MIGSRRAGEQTGVGVLIVRRPSEEFRILPVPGPLLQEPDFRLLNSGLDGLLKLFDPSHTTLDKEPQGPGSVPRGGLSSRPLRLV